MKHARSGISEEAYRNGVGRLRELLASVRRNSVGLTSLSQAHVTSSLSMPPVEEIVSSRDLVLARYQPLFSSGKVKAITREEFASFLYIENNRHWSSLYRHPEAMEDMDLLHKGLSILLDEGRPLAKRYTEAWQMVPGMGKALATAVLMVAYACLARLPWRETVTVELQVTKGGREALAAIRRRLTRRAPQAFGSRWTGGREEPPRSGSEDRSRR